MGGGRFICSGGVGARGRAALSLLLVISACGGGEEPIGDAGVIADAGVGPDAGDVDGGPDGPRGVRVSGRVLRLDSYLEGNQLAVGEASVRVLGAADVTPAIAEPTEGAYELVVPPNGKLVLGAARPGYLQSYAELTVADRDISNRNFYMAYEPHVARMSERFGVSWGVDFPCHAPNVGVCRFALLMGRVVDDGSYAGGVPTPLAGVEANDFTLAGEGNPNWYRRGPYFFFFNGQPDPQATATKRRQDPANGRYEGGLFAFFIEIPVTGPASRDVELRIASYAEGPQRRYFGPTQVKVFRDAFTWTTVAETGLQPPPVEPPPPMGVDFDTQVYPLFLPVAQGGYGCQGCHTNQGGAQPAGGMNLYGGPRAAYGALDPARYPTRVNLATPRASYLLTRPLYEANGTQDHPIFAFFSDQDPAYRLIYTWISEGARRDGDNPMPPPAVSFYNDLRPLLYRPVNEGGAGCYNCHVLGVGPNNAPGGLYFGGDGNALWRALTQDTAQDNGQSGERYRINRQGEIGRSLLLTNPLIGSPEPHPAKIFTGTDDPRYQLIYRWIADGYTNDTP